MMVRDMISFLRHLFIPHDSNNYRSKLLHHKSLFVLFLLVVIFSSFTISLRQSAPQVLGVATNITPQDLLLTTNQKRTENGLAPLALSGKLSSAASSKAQDMFVKDYWAHNAPDGTTPWTFFQLIDYNYIYAGENLAKNFNDSEGVVNAWMASTSHRENMLSARYDEVGFAVVNGKLSNEETTLVVEFFGKEQTLQGQAPTTGASVPPEILPTPASVTQSLVAGVTNTPLIDSTALTKKVSIFILAILILAFILDMIYIERQKLVRLVGHNIDHILFLAGAILFIIVLGKGVIL